MEKASCEGVYTSFSEVAIEGVQFVRQQPMAARLYVKPARTGRGVRLSISGRDSRAELFLETRDQLEALADRLKLLSVRASLTNRAKKTQTIWCEADFASGADTTVYHEHKLQNIHKENADASICCRVAAITALAMLNASILHIKVTYSSESNALEVSVYSTDCFSLISAIFRRNVYLDQPTSREHLLTLEDDLIELVADAKDGLVGAV